MYFAATGFPSFTSTRIGFSGSRYSHASAITVSIGVHPRWRCTPMWPDSFSTCATGPSEFQNHSLVTAL